MTAFLFLLRKKSAAQDRFHAKKREYIPSNIRAGERGRLSSGREVRAITAHQRHLLNRWAILGPCARVGGIDTYRTITEETWKKFANREDTLRVLVSKWPEEHRVDKREDGGVRADTNGERKDS